MNLFLEFISKFWIYIFIVALISYFLGSICFSIIFTKLFKNTDIRNLGSKNAGFTNVLRSVGVLPAVIALAVFLLVFSFSKIISLSSISAAISYPIINFLTLKVYNSFSSTQTYTRTYIAVSTALCIIFSLVIIIKHRENIYRLLNGTEKQLSIKSKNS